ncbi:Serine/threonine-protein kinase PknD [Burkholderiales bacterium]|nr:Serine/threonine-protein kinase PknD [Burkholderiales bacterium]
MCLWAFREALGASVLRLRRRFGEYLLSFLLGLWLTSGVVSAALPPEIQKGADWLAGQVQADGSVLGEASAVAIPAQTRAEVASTLARLSNVPPALLNALASPESAFTELDARKAIALGAANAGDPGSISRLKVLQNPDGGFGSHSGAVSSVLDTAWALIALKAQENFAGSGNAVANALGFLKQQRQPDGAWGLPGQSQVYVTALVLLATHPWKDTLPVGEIVAPAQDWLLASRANGSFGNLLDDALALAALATQTSETAVIQPLVVALTSRQEADGSWGGDPFLTAVALRALWQTTAVATSPTGDIVGKVVDLSTGAGIGAAQVGLLGTQPQLVTTRSDGGFLLGGVSPGSQELVFSATGYETASQKVTVNAGETTNLASIRLRRAELEATVSGLVRLSGGAPAPGALVSVGSASTVTDQAGKYSLKVPAGQYRVQATLQFYHAAAVPELMLLAGQAYEFSPTLYQYWVLPMPATTLGATIVNAVSAAPIQAAAVLAGAASTQTDAKGSFRLNNVQPGSVELQLRAAGFTDRSIIVLLAQGSNDLGVLALQPLNLGYALTGFVRDAETAAAVAGATVSVGTQTTNSSADGRYRLDALNPGLHRLSATAAGYASLSQNVAITQPGDAILDLQLQRPGPNTVYVRNFVPGKQRYLPSESLGLEATIANSGAAAADVVVDAQIFDPQGALVMELAANAHGLGNHPPNLPVSVSPGDQVTLELGELLLRRAAGAYLAKLRVFDPLGRALASAETSFVIESTAVLAGGLVIDPPLTHAGTDTPVSFRAQLTNLGNQPLSAGDLKLQVVLAHAEPSAAPNLELVTTAGPRFTAFPYLTLRAMTRDADGNIYAVSGQHNDGRVFKVTASGEISVFARLPEGAPFVPLLYAVAIDGQGGLWVAGGGKALWHLDAQGALTKASLSQLDQVTTIHQDGQGELYLAGRLGAIHKLVKRGLDGTETLLWENGLSEPTGLVRDRNGDLLVSNAGDGTIARVTADGQIKPYASKLKRPRGLTLDSAGNLLVANAGDGRIVRITPDGQVSTYASGLKEPTDLRFDAGGLLYVSCAGDNTLRTVSTDGVITLFAQSFASGPRSMAYDAAGRLYVANNDGTIRALETDRSTTVLAQGLPSPQGTAIESSGALLVAEQVSGEVKRINNGVMSTFAAGLRSPYGVASGGGQVMVTELSAHRLTKFDASGTRLEQIPSLLENPGQLAVDGNDRILVANGASISLFEGGQGRLLRDGLVARAIVPDPQGGALFVLSGYDVYRLDYSGNLAKLKSLPFYAAGMAANVTGELVLVDTAGRKLHRLDRLGNLAVLTPLTMSINYIASDLQGRVYAFDGHHVLHRMAPDGSMSPLSAFNLAPGNDIPAVLSVARDGRPLVRSSQSRVIAVDPASGAQTVLRSNTDASGVSLDGQGNLWAVFLSAHELRVYDSGGNEIQRHLGFVYPQHATWDGTRFWFFANNGFFSLDASAGSYPIRRSAQRLSGLTAKADGTVFATSGSSVFRWNGLDWTVAAKPSGAAGLTAIAAHASGAVSVADSSDSQVRTFDASWTLVDAYAGMLQPTGLAFDAAGRLYVASKGVGAIARFAAGATPLSAPAWFGRMPSPGWLAFDENGELWVSGATEIVRFAPDGASTVVTAAAATIVPAGILVEGGAPSVLSQSLHQLMRLENDQWRVLASGIAAPTAVRALKDGAVIIANGGNGSVAEWRNGSTRTLVGGLQPVRALSVSPDGERIWASGDQGSVTALARTGEVVRLDIPVAVGRANLTGIEVHASGDRLSLGADIVGSSSSALYEAQVVAHSPPPPANTVVLERFIPMPDLPAAEGEHLLDLGTWTPPWGGDYQARVTREAVPGNAQGALHAGPHAKATLAAPGLALPPKTQTIPVKLNVTGADSSALARVEVGLVKPTITGVRPQGMVADKAGNIYLTDAGKLSRVTPAGQTSTVGATHIFGMGLAIDSTEQIYAPVRKTIDGPFQLVRIASDGTATVVVADLGGTPAGLAVNQQDEVLLAMIGKLLRITPAGAVSTVAISGLPNPVGISIDGKDNVYVLNFGHAVTRITPTGRVTILHQFKDSKTDPLFEYEGMSLAADCGENYYLAASQWLPFGQDGEEYTLVQTDGRTRVGATVLDGRKIHWDLTDIDYIAFDRFGSRLLMWTDYSGGRIWQAPVSCGSISVATHLITRPGQTLKNASIPWIAALPKADGSVEYVWNLREVGAQGLTVSFDTELRDLALGEERQVLAQGYMRFKNTFTPGDVTVPIEIPSVRVGNLVDLGVATDQAAYPAFATAQVTTRLNNPNDTPVTGDLEVTVFDAAGYALATVNREAVTLPPAGVLDVAGQFGVGTILPGAYTVKAELSEAGQPLARGSAQFRVTEDRANGAITGELVLDRAEYEGSDRVAIGSRVLNQSANLSFDHLTLVLTARNVAGEVVFKKTLPIAQLTAGAELRRSTPYAFQSAPAGLYSVTQQVLDAAGLILDEKSAPYRVLPGNQSASGLYGEIKAESTLVQFGVPVGVNFKVANRGNADYSTLPLKVRILEAATGVVRREFQAAAPLPTQAEFQQRLSWETGDAPLPSSATTKLYVAALFADVAGREVALAQDAFQVTTLVPFAFTPKTNVPRASEQTSNPVTLDGLAGNQPISVANGAYSLNGAAYTTLPGTATNGDVITVRHTAAGVYSSKTAATLEVAGFKAPFEVTTEARPCAVPAAFSFSDQSATTGQKVESNAITLSGMGEGCTVQASIQGGAYKVVRNGNTVTAGDQGYTLDPTLVQDGDEVRLRVTAPATAGQTASVAFTAGTVSAPWRVTATAAAPVCGNAVLPPMASKTAAPNTLVTSDAISVSGLGAGCSASASVSGGKLEAKRKGVSLTAGYVTGPVTVQDGDQITVQTTTPAQGGTSKTVVLSVGSVNTPWVVNAAAPSCGNATLPALASKTAAPNTLVTSNAISVSGLSAGCSASASVAGGKLEAKRNGVSLSAGFVTGPVTVQDGDQLTLQATTPTQGGTSKTVQLHVGSASSSWVVNAEAPVCGTAVLPALAAVQVRPGEAASSATFPVAGLNAGCSASASVSGGQLEAKRSGASLTDGFVTGPITVQDGDQLQLQGRAPLQRGASQTVLLHVGTATAPWVISAADHHDAIPIPVLQGGWLLLLGLGLLLAYLLVRGRRRARHPYAANDERP